LKPRWFLSKDVINLINQYELLLWLYKIVNNNFCHDFQLIRVAETHRYPTRSNDKLFGSNFRTNWERDSILIDGLIKFNNLLDIVRNQASISCFKIELKRHLLSKYLERTLYCADCRLLCLMPWGNSHALISVIFLVDSTKNERDYWRTCLLSVYYVVPAYLPFALMIFLYNNFKSNVIDHANPGVLLFFFFIIMKFAYKLFSLLQISFISFSYSKLCIIILWFNMNK
jgi:hypothetical protein